MDQLKRIKALKDLDIGCVDNSCVFGPPGGMGTNGGCCCDERTFRRGIQVLRRELAQLEELASDDLGFGGLENE